MYKKIVLSVLLVFCFSTTVAFVPIVNNINFNQDEIKNNNSSTVLSVFVNKDVIKKKSLQDMKFIGMNLLNKKTAKKYIIYSADFFDFDFIDDNFDNFVFNTKKHSNKPHMFELPDMSINFENDFLTSLHLDKSCTNEIDSMFSNHNSLNKNYKHISEKSHKDTNTLAPVPEPTSMLLLGLSFIFTGIFTRRKILGS